MSGHRQYSDYMHEMHAIVNIIADSRGTECSTGYAAHLYGDDFVALQVQRITGQGETQ